MKNKWLPILFATLMLTGAGCFSSTTTVADGGLWKTADYGKTFTQLKTLPQQGGVGSIAGVNVRDLEIDPNNGAVYYLATEANGFFYSMDYGNTWQRPEEPEMRDGLINDIEVDPKNTCTLYAIKGKRLYKSTDCARSFTIKYTDGSNTDSLTVMAVDWFNPSIIWLGNSGGDLLKSISGGDTWTTVKRINSTIKSMVISNADTRIMMFGTADRGMYRTDDGGGNWVTFMDNLNREFPGSTSVYGFSQLFDGSVTLMNTKYGILYSTDAGVSWKDIKVVTPPAEATIWDVAIDPKRKNIIYYATVGKLYKTENGGQTWSNVELPSKRAPSILQPHPEDPSVLLFGFRTIAK